MLGRLFFALGLLLAVRRLRRVGFLARAAALRLARLIPTITGYLHPLAGDVSTDPTAGIVGFAFGLGHSLARGLRRCRTRERQANHQG